MENSILSTILIVDDKPANTFTLQELLDKQGRTLLVANSGQEALKLALDNEIDLMMLDVHMPEMDGFEVAKTLKLNKKTRDVPIIFVTAEKKERLSMMKGLEGGAIDYLFKPLDPEITRAKVDVLLKMQFQKKELIDKNLALEKADRQIKALNAELEKNILSLEVANKELESFSYSVSHDLRSPLRALSAYSSIMMEDYAQTLDTEGKKVLDTIANNAKKMSQMVDNLLDFSRLGRKEVNKNEVDMDALVSNCLNDIGDKGNVTIDKQALFNAPGDVSLLAHVWTNLLTNAIKYSSKNAAPHVEVGSYEEGDYVVYYVKDNGVGFDMAYADKLFGVFQRLHTTEEFKGVGIGLAIVHKIVTRHGGKVWVKAEVNKGASFYFSLPKK